MGEDELLITAADGNQYNTKHFNFHGFIALNRFSEVTDHDVLQNAGKVTAEIVKAHAESEFEKYRIIHH